MQVSPLQLRPSVLSFLPTSCRFNFKRTPKSNGWQAIQENEQNWLRRAEIEGKAEVEWHGLSLGERQLKILRPLNAKRTRDVREERGAESVSSAVDTGRLGTEGCGRCLGQTKQFL